MSSVAFVVLLAAFASKGDSIGDDVAEGVGDGVGDDVGVVVGVGAEVVATHFAGAVVSSPPSSKFVHALPPHM